MTTRFPAYSLSLLCHRKDIFSDVRANRASWFRSDEGEAAFRAAQTPAQRVAYLYRYLSFFDASSAHYRYNDIRLRVATLMAYGVWGTDLSYGHYPDILDEKKNPILDVFLHGKLKDCLPGERNDPQVLAWLEALYGQTVTAERLSHTDPQAEPTLWQASRLILWLFQPIGYRDTVLPEPYTLDEILDGVDDSCLPPQARE